MSVRSHVGTLPLRVRLVAGFSAAMFVLLVAAGAFVYWRVEYALDRGIDTELASARDVIAPLVGAGGAVSERRSAEATGAGWQVLGPHGAVLDHGGPAPPTPLVATIDLPSSGTATVEVGSMLPAAREPFRVEVSRVAVGYLVVAARRDHRDEALRELLGQMALAGAGALVIASVVGDQLARRALQPVERYRSRAAAIAAGDQHRRLEVPSGRNDEVTRLGHTLNDMLAAIEESLARERRFVADASHELRTPLALLRSRIQLTQRRTRSVPEHETALAELAVDVERLVALAEELLELDRDTSVAHASGEGTDVVSVVGAEVERWHGVHPDQVELVAQSSSARVPLAPASVERVVTNLLANAIAHGAPPIRVTVRRDSGYAVLAVADAGPGMHADLLAHATSRFSRAPEARSRPGAGLGLALVEHLVTAADGELRLCHAGSHASTGRSAQVPCGHDARMTATVLWPLVRDRETDR